MNVWTCYSDPPWCGEVPLEVPTKNPFASSISNSQPLTTPTTESNSKWESTKKTTRTAKPTQTDDNAQPDPTQPLTQIITTTPTPTASGNESDNNATPSSTLSAIAANTGNNSGGVSKGAVAGIAIAMLIIGGAIAFIVAFMLFKRRRRPSGHGHSDSNTNLITAIKGGEHPSYVQVSQNPPPPVAAAAIPTTSNRSLDLTNLSQSSDFLAGVLPPAADEEMVKSRVVALLNRIHQHVDDFYRDIHATLTPSMQNDLKKFGDASVNIADELEHSPNPTIAIKHALVGYILNIVAPEAEEQSTLFPTEVAGLKEKERSIDSPEDQAAYILYRRLAAHLHSPPASFLQSLQSDIREAAEHFALAFFPWANPADADQDKDDNLVDVIDCALDLSLWLFGQPYMYEWVWEEVGSRGMVIAPALVRVTDEKGRTVERPQRLVDAVIAAG